LSYGSRQQLVEHPKVQALYENIVAEVNKTLAQYETIKSFLVSDEFTVAVASYSLDEDAAPGHPTAISDTNRRTLQPRCLKPLP